MDTSFLNLNTHRRRPKCPHSISISVIVDCTCPYKHTTSNHTHSCQFFGFLRFCSLIHKRILTTFEAFFSFSICHFCSFTTLPFISFTSLSFPSFFFLFLFFLFLIASFVLLLSDLPLFCLLPLCFLYLSVSHTLSPL